jgi:histone-lysine N-methyltransferase SETD3
MFSFFITPYLLEEQQKIDSFWRPYIDTLPVDFSNFLAFYTPEEISMCEGSQIGARVSKMIEKFSKEYQLLCSDIPEYKQIEEQAFRKAKLLTLSRTFQLATTAEGSDSGMVPLVDMMNHKPPGQNNIACYWDAEADGFVAKANCQIRRNDELYNTYGERSNITLLTQYGFTILGNESASSFPINI